MLRGGRVLDPESGLDAVRNVAVTGRTIAAVSSSPLRGKVEIDAAGLVVSPGFIDLHSHSDWILPHVSGRVLSLLRHPSGVNEKGFFAKHPWHGLGAAVQRVDVGEKEKMLAIDNLEGLIELVQAGIVEIHPWGSTVAHLENPDRLIFDLDPAEDVPWSAVIEGALDVRRQLG